MAILNSYVSLPEGKLYVTVPKLFNFVGEMKDKGK